MKINVLGTEYAIDITSRDEHPALGSDYDGMCDPTTKKICIAQDTGETGGVLKPGDAAVAKAGVLRHELVHAFLCESGLNEYSSDETLVDWIAIQLPKMVEAMNEAGCLDAIKPEELTVESHYLGDK